MHQKILGKGTKIYVLMEILNKIKYGGTEWLKTSNLAIATESKLHAELSRTQLASPQMSSFLCRERASSEIFAGVSFMFRQRKTIIGKETRIYYSRTSGIKTKLTGLSLNPWPSISTAITLPKFFFKSPQI